MRVVVWRRITAWRVALSDVDERVAIIAGLVFIPAGLVKFIFPHWELHALKDFGIPARSVLEPLVGALETIGGVLLVARRLIAATAVTLAVVMAVAFVTGGLIHGDLIPSETLAPALLAAMLFLLLRATRAQPADVG